MKNSLTLTLCYMGFLLLVSSIPAIPGTERAWNLVVPRSPAIDDLFHISAYGLLAVLWTKALKENGTETYLRLVTALVVTSAYGAITELSQIWVRGRCPSLLDWLFDIAGALMASGLVWLAKSENVSNTVENCGHASHLAD